MEIRIRRKKWQVFGYDVENHNDDESIAKNETSVWLSVFAQYGDEPTDDVYFYDENSFIEHLEKLTRTKYVNRKKNETNLLIYVYNLAHEWSFLLWHLINDFGFKWRYEWDEKEDDGRFYNSVSNKSCASVWEARLWFGKKHGSIVFRDLSKILPGGLRNVAKSYGLQTQKGDLDYKLNRLHGHVVTDEERLYCYKDVEIMLEIINVMASKEDKDFFKVCSSASYSMLKMIREGYPKARKPYKLFRKDYPELGTDENEFLRKSVAGGITYAPEAFQFCEINTKIGHIDIHQAHPNSAYRFPYPYGKGTYFRGEPPTGRYMACCRVLVSFSGVKLHSVIKLIGVSIATDYELTLWDFEVALMKKCYFDFEVKYIDGYYYRFKRLPWREYYFDNFLKREQAKASGDKFNVMYYKLLNNSSYGKLLEKPHNTAFENCIIGSMIDSLVHTNETTKQNAKYTYLPVGSSIPARTRAYLIETALKIGWTKIVYFDTDSIFYIKDNQSEENLRNSGVLGDKLGDFAPEKDIERMQVTAPKRYKIKEINEDGTSSDTAHLAGVNFAEPPSYDDLDLVSGRYIIQGRRRAKGGTLIVLKEKHLSVQKKYQDTYTKNNKKSIV